MKPTLLFATLSMVLSTPTTFAKSELETLRSLCSEQERQIHLLENENAKLRSGSGETRAPIAKSEPAATKPATTSKTSTDASTSATYTVKEGDLMEKIARQVGVSPDKLAKANDMTVNSIIRPGQKLKVPGKTAAPTPTVSTAPTSPSNSQDKTHKVKEGETLASISKKHGISKESLAAANPKLKVSTLRPGQIVNLSRETSSTTMISATESRPKTQEPEQKAPTPVAKTPEVRQNAASAKSKSTTAKSTENKSASSAPKPEVTENSDPSPSPEKKIRPLTIDSELTYGEFAAKHGTTAERLNALNGLDLTTATVLAKGSELYVPTKP